MSSRALPSHMYGDPADIVEYDQMDALGCLVCKSYQEVLCNGICADVRNEFQKGVPNIGHRCKWFIDRG